MRIGQGATGHTKGNPTPPLKKRAAPAAALEETRSACVPQAAVPFHLRMGQQFASKSHRLSSTASESPQEGGRCTADHPHVCLTLG